MTTLVVGATGMTGGPLVSQLLAGNHSVRAIVRAPEKLSAEVLGNPNFAVTEAGVAHFMSELIENDELWSTWKFRMPVIMNSLE